ncbi:MAG: hypothetical protein ABIU54_10580 [Candidatus Eisenbacteria bacterium]
MSRGRRALFGAAVATLWLASCAPPPTPGDLTTFAARYRIERARRAGHLAAAEADMVLRIEGRAIGRLPGLIVSTGLAAPDRARLRGTWMLGTAFDLLAERDSVRVWLPTEHAVLELGGLADSLRRPRPLAILFTALAASWDPPESAWRGAIAESSDVRMGWREGGDSLSLEVDGASRPSQLRIEREGRVVWVRYSGWRNVGGIEWPVRIEIADANGWFRLRTELQSLRAVQRLNESWFELRVPADAERLDWPSVRARLSARREDRP